MTDSVKRDHVRRALSTLQRIIGEIETVKADLEYGSDGAATYDVAGLAPRLQDDCAKIEQLLREHSD
jgi:hypothetical protein